MKTPNNLMLVLGSIAALSACNPGQADPAARGEHIHDVCLSCHGTSLYESPRRYVKSLPQLYKEVARWGDYYNPALSTQDVNDVTVYLNKNFYKFPEEPTENEKH